MSKYREHTRYDVVAKQAIKTAVLSIKDEFYTVELDAPTLLSFEQRSYLIDKAGKDASNRLLEELHKYVKVTIAEQPYGSSQVTAKVFLPYIQDEVVVGLKTELRGAKADTSLVQGFLANSESNNRKLTAELNRLESLWFVRLYNWITRK